MGVMLDVDFIVLRFFDEAESKLIKMIIRLNKIKAKWKT